MKSILMLDSQPPRLLRFPPLRSKIRLSFQALNAYRKFLCKYCYELWPQFKHNFFKTSELARKLKLRKRFLTGAYLGFLISKYLLEGKTYIPERVHALNGELFGFWGITIIASDHYIDTGSPNRDYAKVFLERLLGVMHRKPGFWRKGTPETGNLANYSIDNNILETIPIHLGGILRQKIDELSDVYKELNRSPLWPGIQEEFCQRSRELLEGQWRSLEQFAIDDSHNWRWFVTEILNQKTLNFFLAPVPLFCLSQQSSERFACLKHFFLQLNSAYLHWQLLDDLADTIPDTLSGMMTTPGFMLISQGQLAADLRPLAGTLAAAGPERKKGGGVIAARVLESVQSSYLLENSFHRDGDGKIHRYEPPISETTGKDPTLAEVLLKAKAALANGVHEDKLSLAELCENRIKDKEELSREMRQGNRDKALKILLESRVGLRVLAAVQDAHRVAPYREHLLAVENQYLLSILQILNRLISRAYQRAWRIWIKPVVL